MTMFILQQNSSVVHVNITIIYMMKKIMDRANWCTFMCFPQLFRDTYSSIHFSIDNTDWLSIAVSRQTNKYTQTQIIKKTPWFIHHVWGRTGDMDGGTYSERHTKEMERRRGRSRLRSLPPWRKAPQTHTHTPFQLCAIYSSLFTDLPFWLISFVVLSAGCFYWVPYTRWHTWLWL